MYHLGRSAKLNKYYISGLKRRLIFSALLWRKVVIFYSGRAKSHDYEVMKVRPCSARTKEI
mgnify:FL=1